MSAAGLMYRLPFYSLFKTIFFLYLSLPQTEVNWSARLIPRGGELTIQGSTYVYRAHLAPLFYDHEQDIDAALNGLRSRATETITGAVGMIWEKVRQQLNVSCPNHLCLLVRLKFIAQIATPAYPEYVEGHEQVAAPQVPPPTFQDPAGGAVQQMYGLFGRYAAQWAILEF
jgi:receptor expression-enhancing protein 1/2/3/4